MQTLIVLETCQVILELRCQTVLQILAEKGVWLKVQVF